MQKIFLYLILTTLSITLKAQADWEKTAEGMSRALITHFWGASFQGYPDRYYFNYGSDISNMVTYHYWPQAHAMDVMVDAYLRTSDPYYLDFYPLWWEGAPRYNSGKPEDPWWNVYVDDMEWIVLAQLRMFESSHQEKYFTKAKQLYNEYIWPTWGPENEAPWFGGITWKIDVSKSKNACSNGPAAIIAARIYSLYSLAAEPGQKSRQAYLDEAVKIYAWLRKNLYDPAEGKVYDNMNSKGGVGRAVYTYNQGTFIGAAHELYKITGNKDYLADAVQASNYVVDHLSDNNGVLRNATGGDGGLFNGIFFRYFVKLINEPALDGPVREKFHRYITHCATVMSENGINPKTMLYGGDWWKAPADTAKVGLTPMLSGCMLMEAMCVLKPLSSKAKTSNYLSKIDRSKELNQAPDLEQSLTLDTLINTDNANASLRDSIVSFGMKFLGTPYVEGGCSKEGFDCSGFVYFVFRHFNIEVPRSSSQFVNYGKEIPIDSVRRGDILLFLSPTRNVIGHVGIVTNPRGKESDFIHSSSGREMKVIITSLRKERYLRRYVKALNVVKSEDLPFKP